MVNTAAQPGLHALRPLAPAPRIAPGAAALACG